MPTDEQLIASARALAPAIRARAAETERLRRPHDDTMRELAEAGILQMFVPKRWGGSEARLGTMLDVVEEISSACVSTGWVTAFYIGHNIYVGKFDEQAQEEVFGPRGYTLLPAATAPTMVAERRPGGWEISGRASWGTGIMHADWVLVSGRTEEGPRSFLLPVSDVEVKDVWHYTGMAGTGSNDFVVDKVFVPDHRTVSGIDFHQGATAGSAIHANPLYATPFLVLAYCTIVGVLTGGLKGAMGEYETLVKRRVRNFSGVVVKDQQHAHIELGDMEIRTRIAGDLARQTFDRAEAMIGKRPITLEDRLAMKGHVAFVSKHCRDTANAMMANAGASSFHADMPLQRFWRDLNTVCSHAFWDWDATRELVGRQLLDLPPNNPLV